MEPVELVELKKGGDEEGAVFDPRGHRPTRRGLASMAALSILLGGAMLGVAIVPRMHRASMLEVDERRAAAAVPRVSAARAERAVSHAALALPGTVEALQETSIYARANGYVRTWRVDIGARVKRGQVLVDSRSRTSISSCTRRKPSPRRPRRASRRQRRSSSSRASPTAASARSGRPAW